MGVALVSLLAAPAWAGDLAPGCFERNYSDAHLAKNPAQVVDRMVLHLTSNGDETVGRIWITTARQGHVMAAGLGGQRFSQFLICWAELDGLQRCGVECDGGTFTVTRRDDKSLTFETKYLLVGEIEDCGGAVDLAEAPGQMVSYRLNAAADAVCLGEY